MISLQVCILGTWQGQPYHNCWPRNIHLWWTVCLTKTRKREFVDFEGKINDKVLRPNTLNVLHKQLYLNWMKPTCCILYLSLFILSYFHCNLKLGGDSWSSTSKQCNWDIQKFDKQTNRKDKKKEVWLKDPTDERWIRLNYVSRFTNHTM